jgi:hypothetical protein
VRYKIVRKKVENIRGCKCEGIDIPHLSSIRDMWVHDVRCMDTAKFEGSPMLRGHMVRLHYMNRSTHEASYLYAR